MTHTTPRSILALATAGLGWMYALFWRLIHASRVPDRVHAKAVHDLLETSYFDAG